MYEKQYICVCGQVFDRPNSLNGHRSHCKVHIESKGLNYDRYEQSRLTNILINSKKGRDAYNENLRQKKLEKEKQELEKWISEQHTCEKCGKIMIEKYGSGRFCCRQCSNSRTHTEESKLKTSQSMKKRKIKLSSKEKLIRSNKQKQLRYVSYMQNPRICKVCNSLVPYERRNKNYCSRNCAYANSGGYRENSSYGKRGNYKGIHCDSTYELAFLIYCFDHNVKVIRNKDYFKYFYRDKWRKYFPDFYLPDYDVYIETKGRVNEVVYAKANALPEGKLILLDTDGLETIFKYIRENYPVRCNKSNNNLYILYD